MQKLLVGFGIVVVVTAFVVGVYLWSERAELGRNFVSSAPAGESSVLAEPLGRSRDPNDPGEIHYRHGRYPEAIAYWEAEAAKGNAQAAHRLGVEYMDGKPGVVQRDYARAIRYHRQAALAGKALSMFDLGSIYEHGLGIDKNIVESALWYGHSANYGLAQGQYNFATMLEDGAGVTRDMVEAYKFFILAARGGFTGVPYDNRRLSIDRDAPLPTQLLERKLSREEAAEGRRRADVFRPASGPLKSE
jgi:TPR repeat protein